MPWLLPPCWTRWFHSRTVVSTVGGRWIRRNTSRTIAATTLCLAATLLPTNTYAADFEITGDVAAQAYDVANPFGDQILARRRLYSTLGLAAYNLQGDYQPFQPNYSIQLRMRVDTDFNVDSAETSYTPANASRFLAGYQQVPVDLMYGYVEGKNLLGGALGFRLGRQYVSDVLGWWSFDGGLVRIVTPFFVQAEIYGGLEQRGGLPLSTNRFESQGVWRGKEGELGNQRQNYPSYQFASPAPAFGFALESNGPNWIHGRFDYRRVYNTGSAITGQFPDGADRFESVSGMRLSSERFGYALSAFLAKVGALRGGFAYDVYNGLINRAYGSVEGYIKSRVTVGADFDYFVPTFDADSIWNWFSHSGNMTAQLRGAAKVSKQFDLSASGGARFWLSEGNPNSWAADQCDAATSSIVSNRDQALADCLRFGLEAASLKDEEFSRNENNRAIYIAPDAIANAGARVRWGKGHAALNGMLQMGVGDAASNRGRRVGGSLSAKQRLVDGLMWLGGRVSVYDWADPLRPTRDATSFSYVVAPQFRPFQGSSVSIEWEHNMNRLVGQRFRVLAMLRMRLGVGKGYRSARMAAANSAAASNTQAQGAGK